MLLTKKMDARVKPAHDSGDWRRRMQTTRYIGQSIKRLEDRPLLTGAGRFVADLQFSGMLEAAFVRSPHAHAAIRGIDTSGARRYPGVHAVLTLADLAPLLSQV